MGELLINKANNPVEIPKNYSTKNEYISTILQSPSANNISVEVSPNSDFEANIFNKINPRFIAVTWLGNTHLEFPTQEIPAIALAKKFCDSGYTALLHLVGRNLEKDRMLEILTYLKEVGIKNILALQGEWSYVLEKDDSKCDFPHASDLVAFIKANFRNDFCVGVTGYPSGHPHCRSVEENMKFLKLKVDSGADFIITQATFDYETLENFAVTCKQHHINVPIFPGIFVIRSFEALANIAKYCEFKVAPSVFEFVEKNRENVEVIENYGVDLAADLIRKCVAKKEYFAGAHVFSMNDLLEVEKVLEKI